MARTAGGTVSIRPRTLLVTAGALALFGLAGWAITFATWSENNDLQREVALLRQAVGTEAGVKARLADLERRSSRATSAVVSREAAVAVRERQLAAAITRLDASESDAAAARAEEARAKTAASDLAAGNTAAATALVRNHNRLVPMIAAIGARERQLADLGADVEAASASLAAAARWETEREELDAASAQIERDLVRARSRLVSLSAAAEARQRQVNVAAAAQAKAETADREATLSVRRAVRTLDAAEQRLALAEAETALRERDLVRSNNRLVPLLAAVSSRQAEVTTLAATVGELEQRRRETAAAAADAESRYETASGALATIRGELAGLRELIAKSAALVEPAAEGAAVGQ
ncbi:coiled-coil domain-containing protein [Methylobrevis albus]|uniref:Uncharacterized protein n=1 Tax=Methylobrevis albus TaxID=2793297 RepID=A0A931I0C2_9HYPH|nr:hypothetical protein [Methylobrevis albus]MBH0237094.1 hypothetical protein [Methylobrevis albus]